MSLSTVRCRILGQAEIHTRGIRLTPESELQFGLALYFCAQAGREVPRDEIVRLFWPTHTLEAGRHCLRQAIYRLRVLGVAVQSGAKATILETHYIDADFAPAAADGAPASVYLRLTDVSILPGYSPRFSRPFANWVEDFRTDLGGRIRRGLVRAISEMRARGRYAEVERLCRFCLRLDPLNEEATLALAESVALAGGKAEAVGLIARYEGEVGHYPPELRVSAGLLRERISDRLIRRSQAAIELPMVGRDRDVERVLTAFQRLKGNRAVSYVVTGPAGVGKTRLAIECCRMASLQGARLLTIGTQPSSRTQALFAVSELVDGLLQMPGAIGCAPAALDCLKAMSSPISVREPSLSLDTDGEARFAMVRWSILDVLDAILSEGPLVIHVDDAHQLDSQSQAILEDAIRTHGSRQLLLLLTMRPPDAEDASRIARLLDISVAHELLPLSDENCDVLVRRFCAANEDSLDDATRERIIQLSGGNPFFLVELLKHRTELVADELPVTVQALLEDRLARLSATALSVLRAAAILGLSSTVERLQRVLEQPTTDILLALSELHSAGMLSSSDGGTHCRHDTIREAVLDRTPTAARALLHRRAARMLGEEALRDGGVALLWECVHHWRSTEATRTGVRFSLVLAKRLLRLGLAADAVNVLVEIDSPKTALDQRLRAHVAMASAFRMLRDWRGLQDVSKKWRELQRDAGRQPKPHTKMELLEFEIHYNGAATFGTIPRNVSECICAESATTGHRLAAAALAMIAADNTGDEESAHIIYKTIEEVHPESTAERLDRLTIDAVFHTTFGELNRAPAILREMLELALTLDQPAVRAAHVRRACFGIARYESPALARPHLVASLETFEQLRLWSQAVLCIEYLGTIAISESDYDDARFWINRACEMRNRGNDVFLASVEYELRILLAFERMDAALLPTFSLSEDVSDLWMRLVRSRQTVLALRAAQHIVAGNTTPLMPLLEELETLHQRMRCRGYQDFKVAVLTTGLSLLGRDDKARTLLEGYFQNERRELLAWPPVVSRIARQINVAG